MSRYIAENKTVQSHNCGNLSPKHPFHFVLMHPSLLSTCTPIDIINKCSSEILTWDIHNSKQWCYPLNHGVSSFYMSLKLKWPHNMTTAAPLCLHYIRTAMAKWYYRPLWMLCIGSYFLTAAITLRGTWSVRFIEPFDYTQMNPASAVRRLMPADYCKLIIKHDVTCSWNNRKYIGRLHRSLVYEPQTSRLCMVQPFL
jgi:hypothetical protein